MVEEWIKSEKREENTEWVRDSIVVSIPACHAGDPGSIPGRGAFFVFCYSTNFKVRKLNVL